MKLFLMLLLISVFALPGLSVQKTSPTKAKAKQQVAPKPEAETKATPPSGALKELPTLNLQDFSGKTVKQTDLTAKAYIVDFWATWCGPCIVEIPNYNRLQEKYGDKGLKVLGVTLASGEAAEVKPYIEKLKMKYTVLLGDDDQAGDLRIMGFPTTFVVTKDWKIYKTYIGLRAGKAEQIEADIQKLLSEEQVSEGSGNKQ
jgi:thiol-disulfide isomerase/thioredoxin